MAVEKMTAVDSKSKKHTTLPHEGKGLKEERENLCGSALAALKGWWL
jgi:hypothetical protein